MQIARISCPDCGVWMDGRFEVSPLARLAPSDQAFVLAFVKSHGSIKEMESQMGVSYPTVKNRLNAICSTLDQSFESPPARILDVLDRLSRGEIDVDQALSQIP
jgi:hypothetical protein